MRTKLVFILALLLAHTAANADELPKDLRDLPQELQVADPDLRKSWIEAFNLANVGKRTDAESTLSSAVQKCAAKGLISDCAVLKALLGQSKFLMGDFGAAEKQYRESLDLAIKSSNLILQADLYTSLSFRSRIENTPAQARDYLQRAFEAATTSRNRYILSRVLGEKASFEFWIGQLSIAENDIDAALQIDEANDYPFKPLHLLYRAQIIGSSPTRKGEAQVLAAESFDKAVKEQNWGTAVTASITSANLLASLGRQLEAISLLQDVLEGRFKSKSEIKSSEEFRSFISLPLMRMSVMVTKADILSSINRLQDALDTYKEVHDAADNAGLDLLRAASALEIAKLDRRLGKLDDAAQSSRQASTELRRLGYESQWVQASLLLVDVLMDQKKYSDALNNLQELSQHAQRKNDQMLLFTVDSATGMAHFRNRDFEKATEVWQEAEGIIPSLASDPKLDRKVIAEQASSHFGNLFLAYQQTHRVLSLIAAVTRAISVAEEFQSEESYRKFSETLSVLVKDLKIKEEAEKASASSDWIGAMTLYQALDALESRDGIDFGKPLKFDTPSAARLAQIPWRLAANQEGARLLENHLAVMGPSSRLLRRVGYDALLRFYMGTKNYGEAYRNGRYLQEFLQFDDVTVPSEANVQVACILTFAAYASSAPLPQTKTHLATCQKAARLLGEPNLLHASQQLTGQILSYADPTQAIEALSKLAVSSPDDVSSLITLADSLRNQGKLHDALEIWDRLQKHFEVERDLEGQCRTQLSIAMALVRDSRERDPRSYFESAIAGFVKLNKKQETANAELTFVDYWMDRKDWKAALVHVRNADALQDQAKDPSLKPSILVKTADIYSSFDARQSIEIRQQAIALYRTANLCREVAGQLRSLGGDYASIRDFDKAQETFRSAIVTADKCGDPMERQWSRQQLGSFLVGHSEVELGLRSLRAAKEISEKAGFIPSAGWSSYEIAWALTNLGEWSDAAVEGVDTLRLSTPNPNNVLRFFALELLMNVYGDRRSSVKDLDKALRYYKEASEILNAEPSLKNSTLSDILSEIYWQKGQIDEAILQAQNAIQKYRSSSSRNSLAQSLLSLSELQSRKGDLKKARTNLDEAKKIIGKDADPYTVGRWYYTKARLERANGQSQSAAQTYEAVLAELEKLKSQIHDAETSRMASSSYSFLYDELVSTFLTIFEGQAPEMQRAASVKALEYADADKNRTFLALWAPSFAKQLRKELPITIRDREQILAYEHNLALAKVDSAESINDSKAILVAKDAEVSAQKNLHAFIEEIRKNYPRYASVAYPTSIKFERLQRPKDETLVVFRVTEDSTYVWIFSPDISPQFYKVSKPRAWFREKIGNVREILNGSTPGQLSDGKLKEIFSSLFPTEKAVRSLTQSTSLAVIPDGPLFLLPLEMMPSSSQSGDFPLIGKSVSYYPSLSIYALNSEKVTTAWSNKFIAFGNPLLNKPPQTDTNLGRLVSRGISLDPLPGTEAELKSISSLFGTESEKNVFLGADATKQRVMRTDLSGFRFVHFATHGLLPADSNLQEPALVFSYANSGADAFLQMSDVLQLQLTAESVVLSACNTGSGSLDHAEGVHNLGRAFLLAGARTATVSLWQVADDSTVLLMRRYYEGILAGKSKATALGEARMTVFNKGFKSPFYWAPFILLGN